MSQGPDVQTLLTVWWNGGCQDNAFFGSITQAANLIFGPNPAYQIDDFLDNFPKWGTYAQAVATGSIANGGENYVVGDTLAPIQQDAQNCVFSVTTVDANGAVTGITLTQGGSGFSIASGLATNTNKAGSGCTLNITAIVPPNLNIPQSVLQMYINLATASLQFARWGATWQIAVGWFVDHFATLWQASNGNAGTTPGAIARSGLALGIIVSHSEGEVSKSIEPPDLGEFSGTWSMTISGQQLVEQAKVIGMGPMYIW
jgi:hypothetical protein